MPTFTPPVADGDLIYDPGKVETDGAHALWSHYGSWARGKTIWKDQAGVWHESLLPYHGGGTHVVFDGGEKISETGPDEGLATAQKVYIGGHTYDITEAEATELVAQGYEVDLGHALINNFGAGYISTPDHADFSFGDNEVEFQLYGVGAANWAPVFLSTWVMAKGNSPTNEWAMTFHQLEPRFALYGQDGTLRGFNNPVNHDIGIPSGVPYGCRVVVRPPAVTKTGIWTVDYYIGASGNDWDLRLSGSNTPTELGGLETWADNTGDLTIPGGNGGLPWMIKIFWAKVIVNGVLVAYPDMRQLPAGTTNFVDSTGKTWTLTGPATIG